MKRKGGSGRMAAPAGVSLARCRSERHSGRAERAADLAGGVRGRVHGRLAREAGLDRERDLRREDAVHRRLDEADACLLYTSDAADE